MSVAAPELLGHQRPRILSVPPARSSAGAEAADLASKAGLFLDPWQTFVLEQSLGETAGGKWSAFEVGLLVSRQNGKGSILEARELAGLFLFDEELILHSAHEFKTAQEAFRRIRDLIDGNAMFSRRVKRITNNTFEVGIELMTGQRLRFVARSTGSGRGFSGDCVILDEAFNLPDTAIDALMPVMSARPNPQLWYTSSAPDKDLAPCAPLARIRRRGEAGGDPSLFYAEWSIVPHGERCHASCELHDDVSNPESWAKANPGLGIRLSAEHTARELRSMGKAGFSRERLGVGNYPAPDGGWQVISEAAWSDLSEAEALPVDPVALAVDMTPDRKAAAISAAWRRADGFMHVEVIRHNPGTGWVVGELLGMVERNSPCQLVIDPGGPAGSLIADLAAGLEELGVELEITKPSMRDVGQACGWFYDAVTPTEGKPTLRYTAYAGLTSAVAGAVKRKLGDAWAWDRLGASVDICPLVAVTLAAWGFITRSIENLPAPAGPSKQTLDKFGGNELFRPTSRLAI
jgi:hypothetical protein